MSRSAEVLIPQELIAHKRDGGALEDAEIEAFVAGLTNGGVSDAQAAAFAMAVFFRGLDSREAAALARAMARSGVTLDWRSDDLPGPVIDKHSTGGVGDLVSLALAPMAAACGVFVPMIAGRGLGHTGGTIDKLAAIPGYQVAPGQERFRATVRDAGCAIIGQTEDLAPADGRLYALRDVTATVESIPLIVASILSKKLSAGLQGLIMDVKTGSGAFLPERSRARALARALAQTAAGAGLPCVCLLTDMDEPLAPVAGNALETRFAIDLLTGARTDARALEVIVRLAVEMLRLGGLAQSNEEARAHALSALSSGAAAERFARMVRALGGPADLLERPHAHLPAAKSVRAVKAERAGFVGAIDTRALGVAVVALGGGRTRPGQAIDLSVGLDAIARVGDAITPGDILARVHARSNAEAEAAAARVRSAFQIAEERPRRRRLVQERVGLAATD